jgi:hypothetical protein
MLARRSITDHAIQGLQPDGSETEQWEVGDHEKPRNGGWQGDPGRSSFVAYVVLTVLSSQSPNGPVSNPTQDVLLPMGLACYGASRSQVELMSDLAREKLHALQRTTDGNNQTFGGVTVARYGGVQLLGTEPVAFAITETVNVWITR